MTVQMLKELAERLPGEMKFETEKNKKAGYHKLAEEILAAKEDVEKDWNVGKVTWFLKACVDTIPEISQEIYEIYRKVREAFREVALLYVEKENLDSTSEEYRSLLGNCLKRGCELGAFLTEKYYPIAQVLCGEEVQIIANGALDSFLGECPVEISDNSDCVKVINVAARTVAVEIADGGLYNTKETYQLLLNGKEAGKADTVITSLFDLYPETDYNLTVVKENGEIFGAVSFTTAYESVTINVKDLGAKGDGETDDTHFLQGAIMACPKDGRVLIPEGVYRISSLFLKSNIAIEIAKGAELKAFTEREKFVHFPAQIEKTDESGDYDFGTWEGNPLPMFAGIICGIEAENVLIYGQGTINGNASKQNWWNNPKVMNVAFRPRLFFINHCKKITLQGLKLCNSPAWTMHPFFSDDLKFINLSVENPADSPNTDGLDPESCKNLEVLGVRFSLGDDCIAIKSGKIYMGSKFKQPTENMHIYHCLMENGHGAVTLGSEMAGGVKNLTVESCFFSHTDRGLRIKTRRGRGKDATIDNVIFKDIRMDHVMTPFVVNCFYFCDPDGRTEYVQSREVMPVDERTPYIHKLEFCDIEAKNCHVAAAHFDGLPECKIDEIAMRNVNIGFTDEAKVDVPAMSEGVEACSKKGIFARNVKQLVLENVCIEGQVGEPVLLEGVDKNVTK